MEISEGQKLGAYLGAKWEDAASVATVTAVVGPWIEDGLDELVIVDVELVATRIPQFDDGKVVEVFEESTHPVNGVFVFPSADDARWWVNAGHQSIGLYVTA